MKNRLLMIAGIIGLIAFVVLVGILTNVEKTVRENIMVEIKVKDHGVITAELYPSKAPITVDNFVGLVEEGFYDGLTFHRILDGFVLQGGMGNALLNSIMGEFPSNGVDNDLKHTRGALSMARIDGYNDSATSQFFIVHEEASSLDGDYAVFGYVTSGMEIVDELCSNTPVIDDNGNVEEANQPIIESIKILSNSNQ